MKRGPSPSHLSLALVPLCLALLLPACKQENAAETARQVPASTGPDKSIPTVPAPEVASEPARSSKPGLPPPAPAPDSGVLTNNDGGVGGVGFGAGAGSGAGAGYGSGGKSVSASGSGNVADHAVVRVFYATDRNRTGTLKPAQFFGNDRGALEFGICSVSIPRDHQMGELEAPSILKLEFRKDPAKHVVLTQVEPQSADQFLAALRQRVAESDRNEAFVFIHGYNVSFEDAARRTGQIAYDLAFDGAPILYSWPSRAEEQGYPQDETNAEWTVPHLKNFLTEVATRSGAKTINLIAHSMGNRALAAALKDIAHTQPRALLPMFHQVVLAAPDIDADVFKALAREIKSSSQRITLYASSNDKALKLSKRFHGYPRAGDSGTGILVIPEVDTIDASAVDTSFIGHSYYGDNRSILADLFHLFRTGHPPEKRFGITPGPDSGSRYFVFRK